MLSYVAQNSYSTPMINSDIPQSWVSSSITKPVPSTHKIVQAMSQDGSAQLGGSSTINILRTPNTSIRRASTMLRCRVDFLVPIVGAGGLVDSAFTFSNPIKGASSLIQRITLSSNSTELEKLDYYSDYHSLLLLHGTSSSYLDDAKCIEYLGNTFGSATNAGASTKSVWVSIPLALGALNSDRDFPLFLAPLQLVVNWQSTLTQIVSEIKVGLGVVGLSINAVSLIYESIEHNQEFITAQMAIIAQGNIFNLPYQSVFSVVKSSEANLMYTIGCSKVSVDALLYTNYIAHLSAAGGAPQPVKKFKSSNQTDFVLYVDNVPVQNIGQLDIQKVPTTVFIEAKRCFGGVLDTQLSSVASTISMITADNVVAGTYLSDSFCGGCNLRRTEEDYCFPGTPVSSLMVQLASTVVAGDITQFHVLYSAVASFDGTGNMVRTC